MFVSSDKISGNCIYGSVTSYCVVNHIFVLGARSGDIGKCREQLRPSATPLSSLNFIIFSGETKKKLYHLSVHI